ncbi:MAG: RHS repeat-associated core domain-containing protein [Pseudomonadota bacterium]
METTRLRRLVAILAISLALALTTCVEEPADGPDAEPEVAAADTEPVDSATPPDVGEIVPADPDPDGDGFLTSVELTYGTDPYNAASHPPDQDGDKIPDPEDGDVDGDGVDNADDAFPYSAAEQVDTDGDGLGNNADADDDGDGYTDVLEAEQGTDPLDKTSVPADLDGDGVPDGVDPDIDGDGVANDADAFPANAAEWGDADGDGTGDNADTDDDDDGYSDALEAEYGTDPLDAESMPEDLDGDGIPDGEDLDVDGDGVPNVNDAFPLDPQQSLDTDGDGIGDGDDPDDDGDGYPDLLETENGSDPLDAGSTPPDQDKDGLPDGADADIDGDGVANDLDAFPTNPAEVLDTDGDGTGDNADDDDDGDGYPDFIEAAAGTDPKDANDKPGDLDGDGIPDGEDPDQDGDGVINSADAFPMDSQESLDTDGDGVGNNADLDDDGDGYPDAVELGAGTDPLNGASVPADLDGDGTPDTEDDDIDGDGVPNADDGFPTDAGETADTDSDGIGDNADSDDDGDGYLDSIEAAVGSDPKDPESVPDDLDGDLVPDVSDPDIDGDGVPNDSDAFPADPTETLDTDGDGVGNNGDDDDDGDGYSDEIEAGAGTDPLDPAVHPSDLDGDGIPDPSDPDIDGDGTPNGADAFPFDPAETADTDGDGTGDAADTDDDGDGYPDEQEIEAGTDPLDPQSKPNDLDGDGIPDAADPDIDGDGWANGNDAFDKDPDEWLDTDGDGVGNNGDLDDDGDGFPDAMELVFQTDPLSPFSFPADLDGDKIPDAIDPDRDGDGVGNGVDAFPMNPNEWLDTDGDGVGNNTDLDDDGDGFPDDLETVLGFDPLDFASKPGDLDGDGIPDISDPDMDGDGVPNGDDAFPLNPVDWLDTDGDGLGDNTDTDDDGDGYPDAMEIAYGTDPLSWQSVPPDMDDDGVPDAEDPDIDGDLVLNTLDAFPENPAEWLDTDDDGVGNNADLDDDGDGYSDAMEAIYLSNPLDPSSTPPDIDGDGIPDPVDPDKDGDGVPNIDDAFPEDPDAWEEVLDEGTFGGDYQDLIPPDADPASFDTDRYSLVRGTVLDDEGDPVEGAIIKILNHTEYGSVETDADGEFTIPVNGGTWVMVQAAAEGFTSGARGAEVPWNDIVVLRPFELVPFNPVQTAVFMDGDPDQVLTHVNVNEAQSVVIALKGDNVAAGLTEDGEEVLTDNLVLSATLYKDPTEMPADLPPTTEFTYCVELKAEGYKDVAFADPVILWIPNDLGFDVGDIVPTGYFDRVEGVWKPMEDGKVVQLLDLDDDSVVDAIDADGDGLADDLDGDGDFTDEILGIDAVPEAAPGDTFWRVEVTHFSPIDCNWPASGAPGDAEPPPGTPPDPNSPDNQPDADDPSKDPEVDVRTGVMHQTVRIPDTPLALHYASSWASAFQIPVSIPVSGDSVPGSLDTITVDWSLAGQAWHVELPGAPNQSIEFLWDGLDFAGNPVNRKMNMMVDVGYTYPASYMSSDAAADEQAANFAAMGVKTTGINAFQPVTLTRTWSIPIYHYQPSAPADAWTLGEAWTLESLYYYDPTSGSVMRGDGSRLTANQFGVIIETVSDDLPAPVRALDVDSSGNIVFVTQGSFTYDRRLYRLLPDGTVDLIYEAANVISDVVVGPDDMIYFTTGSFVYKMRPSWSQPQILVNLFFQYYDCFVYYGNYCTLNIDVNNWGYLYAINRYPGAQNNSSLAIVSPDGAILDNPLNLPCIVWDIAVDLDGMVVAACKNGLVRKIERDGSYTQMGEWASNCGDPFAYHDPTGIAVNAEGEILVAESGCNAVGKILPDGFVAPFAGTGAAGYSGDDDTPLGAELDHPTDVAISPDGSVLIADSGNSAIRRVRKVKPVVEADGDDIVVAVDGQVLIFNEKLQLRKILDPTSLKILQEYTYADTGALATYTDAFDRTVNFITDEAGRIIEIEGVSGAVTALDYDLVGQLKAVTYPGGDAFAFEYAGKGLMDSYTTPGGRETTFDYSDSGRVDSMTNALGGETTFETVSFEGVRTHSIYTPEGNPLVYVDELAEDESWTSTVLTPLQGEFLTVESGDGSTETQIRPDGTTTSISYTQDPKYLTRHARQMITTLPSGTSMETSVLRQYGVDQHVLTVTVNGNDITQIVDLDKRTVDTFSPEGRKGTVKYSDDWRYELWSQVGSEALMEVAYDEAGQVNGFSYGETMTTFDYDEEGCRLTLNPLGGEVRDCFDDQGRAVSRVLEDGSIWTYDHDPDFGAYKINAPDGSNAQAVHDDLGHIIEWHAPGGDTYEMAYDMDGDLVHQTYPDGTERSITREFGVVTQTSINGWNVGYSHMTDGSERLASIISGDGVQLSFGYDGPLITSLQVVGPYTAAVEYAVNENFNISEIDVGGITTTQTYDKDGLKTSVGAFGLAWDDHALLTNVTRGDFETGYVYDDVRRTVATTHSWAGAGIFSYGLDYDAAGQVETKTEILQGAESVYEYQYDVRSRLTQVKKDGVVTEEYNWDVMGNRTLARSPALGPMPVIADSNEHLQVTSQGGKELTWDGNGFLASITEGDQTLTLNYRGDGQLRGATLPDGTEVTWLYDGIGNRVGRKDDGVATSWWLYDQRGLPIARLTGAGVIQRVFVYGKHIIPLGYWEDGTFHHYLLDSNLSVRAVVDDQGNVLQTLDYDSYGNVLTVMDPEFEVDFTYSGGRPIAGTGLLHMGARDYAPALGLFTARDPFGVAMSYHPYIYASGDPINRMDPAGLGDKPWWKKLADDLMDTLGGPLGGLLGSSLGQHGSKLLKGLGSAIPVITLGYSIANTLHDQWNGNISTMDAVGKIAEAGVRGICSVAGAAVGGAIGTVGGALVTLATGGTGAVAIPVGAIAGGVAGGVVGDWVGQGVVAVAKGIGTGAAWAADQAGQAWDGAKAGWQDFKSEASKVMTPQGMAAAFGAPGYYGGY